MMSKNGNNPFKSLSQGANARKSVNSRTFKSLATKRGADEPSTSSGAKETRVTIESGAENLNSSKWRCARTKYIIIFVIILLLLSAGGVYIYLEFINTDYGKITVEPYPKDMRYPKLE